MFEVGPGGGGTDREGGPLSSFVLLLLGSGLLGAAGAARLGGPSSLSSLLRGGVGAGRDGGAST